MLGAALARAPVAVVVWPLLGRRGAPADARDTSDLDARARLVPNPDARTSQTAAREGEG